ncbi:hypothetical protein WG904_04550 [Pedobacter sp. Du54]|uniref:hypothetical protein n=1 Tax=Pedobacter anseongensis TaxID=3133439 RepID=UPI0030B77AB7
MKTLAYIFLALTLCSSCLAQSTLKDGVQTYDGKKFAITKRTSDYSGRTSITVTVVGRFYNTRPPAPKDPYGLPVSKKDIHFDVEKVKEIINTVLASNRKELSANKDRIALSFAFLEQDGSIESISYFLNGNTLIGLKDIAKIDKEIKKNIKATFTGNEHTNYYLIYYGSLSLIF